MTTFDPHSLNPAVHYRLYLHKEKGPVVICVQNFDYPDYDETRILSPEAWDDEAEAEEALAVLVTTVEVLRHNPAACAAIYLHILKNQVPS